MTSGQEEHNMSRDYSSIVFNGWLGEPTSYFSESQYNSLFRKGDSRAADAGRKGGIKSAETRKRKAERQRMLREQAAAALYMEWLTDVTEEELRAFIHWRGRQKRKATLARQALKDINTEEGHHRAQWAREYLESRTYFKPVHRGYTNRWLFSNINAGQMEYAEAKETFKGNYPEIREIFAEMLEEKYREMSQHGSPLCTFSE